MKKYNTPIIEIASICLGTMICNSPKGEILGDGHGIVGEGTGGLTSAPERKVF